MSREVGRYSGGNVQVPKTMLKLLNICARLGVRPIGRFVQKLARPCGLLRFVSGVAVEEALSEAVDG
jgi:hypothetical protein